MIDAITKQPMKVTPVQDWGPVLRVPATQLDEVLKLFRDAGLRCWPNSDVMSFNGEPATGTIQLSRNVKPETAQELLDATP